MQIWSLRNGCSRGSCTPSDKDDLASTTFSFVIPWMLYSNADIAQTLRELQLVLNLAVVIILWVGHETCPYLYIGFSERKFRWDLRFYLRETQLSANMVLEGIWREQCSELTHHKLPKARVKLTCIIAQTLPHSQFKSA